MSIEDLRKEAAQKAKAAEDIEFTVEEIAEALGKDAEEFIECMKIAQNIIDDPTKYTGIKAGLQASRMAALRLKVGMKAQAYKTAAVGRADLRMRKDVLMCLYDALLENVNCLKGLARYERESMS